MRKVVFHYHLFKNAGTSVDALLKHNFPNRWVNKEFDAGQHHANVAQVAGWIRQESDAIAFSSHTAMLPPPMLDAVDFFPIVFVRHPIDRIASAYAFEHKQGLSGVGGYGAVLARHTSLGGYIDVRLSQGQDRQCRNFHVARLAQMFHGEAGDESARAMRALEALPFVGLVEEFDHSIRRLCNWLEPHFPGFEPMAVAENVTRDRSIPLEARLAQIREEIGNDLYQQLQDANAADLAVFDALRMKRD
jgi:hypothetical protein